MRQPRRTLTSLSAAATIWAASLSLAFAQEATPPSQSPGAQPTTPAEPGAQPEPTTTPETTPGATQTPAQPAAAPPPSWDQTEQVQPETVTPSPYTGTAQTPAFTLTDPNEPVIDTTTTRTTVPNRPMLATGTTLFLGSYLPTVIYQAVDDRNDNLYIPIAGPWMDMADKNQDTKSKTLLAMSGVAQGLGALGIVGSLFIPERRSRKLHILGGARQRSFSLAPNVGRGNYGLGAAGRF